MSQTKLGSFVESWANIGVGGSMNWVLTIYVIPILWNPASPKLSSLYMTLFYTGVSFVRSWGLRRVFNSLKFGNTERT